MGPRSRGASLIQLITSVLCEEGSCYSERIEERLIIFVGLDVEETECVVLEC